MVLRHACSVLQTRPFTCSVAGHKAWSPVSESLIYAVLQTAA